MTSTSMTTSATAAPALLSKLMARSACFTSRDLPSLALRKTRGSKIITASIHTATRTMGAPVGPPSLGGQKWKAMNTWVLSERMDSHLAASTCLHGLDGEATLRAALDLNTWQAMKVAVGARASHTRTTECSSRIWIMTRIGRRMGLTTTA